MVRSNPADGDVASGEGEGAVDVPPRTRTELPQLYSLTPGRSTQQYSYSRRSDYCSSRILLE